MNRLRENSLCRKVDDPADDPDDDIEDGDVESGQQVEPVVLLHAPDHGSVSGDVGQAPEGRNISVREKIEREMTYQMRLHIAPESASLKKATMA